MRFTVGEIRRLFNGRLIGSLYMKKMVCKTLLYLPDEITKFVTRNIWFISSSEDSWAFTFRGSDIKNQHLIVLSEELLKQKKIQIKHTILHEIGHVMLGHKNSMGFEQTEGEIRKQELEADLFVEKYFKKVF